MDAVFATTFRFHFDMPVDLKKTDELVLTAIMLGPIEFCYNLTTNFMTYRGFVT